MEEVTEVAPGIGREVVHGCGGFHGWVGLMLAELFREARNLLLEVGDLVLGFVEFGVHVVVHWRIHPVLLRKTSRAALPASTSSVESTWVYSPSRSSTMSCQKGWSVVPWFFM